VVPPSHKLAAQKEIKKEDLIKYPYHSERERFWDEEDNYRGFSQKQNPA
jgi:hypothetical protein